MSRGKGDIKLNVRTIDRTVKRTDTGNIIDLEVKDRAQKRDNQTSTGIRNTVQTVPPPVGPKELNHVYSVSNTVPQCVTAMVVNVFGSGFYIVPAKKGQKPSKREEKLLEDFIQLASVEDESLNRVVSQAFHDKTKRGYGFVEITRSLDNSVQTLEYCKSTYVRICRQTKKEDALAEIVKKIPRGSSTITVRKMKAFKKYVLMEPKKGNVFFKEFGDPRVMSASTGQYESKENPVAFNDKATELLHLKETSEDDYGTPVWLPQISNILGSREAEEYNLGYFRDNTVPPIMVAVSGGVVSEDSMDAMKQKLEEDTGVMKQNRVVVVEALPDPDANPDGANTNIRIDVHKLNSERPDDGLWSAYDSNNRNKVRSAFRFPPIILGQSEDVTFATANVSYAITESQVFSPSRRELVEIINNKVVNGDQGLGLKTVKLGLRGPSISNPDELVKLLTAANTMGALTPRKVLKILEEELDVVIDPLPDMPDEEEAKWEAWMDRPIGLTLREAHANEKVKEEQNKDPEVEKVEETGNINPSQPEHGSE